MTMRMAKAGWRVFIPIHRDETAIETNIAFVAEKEELKPGLIMLRRGDV